MVTKFCEKRHIQLSINMDSNQVNLCNAYFFNLMMQRRRKIITAFFNEHQKSRKSLRIHINLLRRQLLNAQEQIPRQIFKMNTPRFRRFKSKNRERSHYENLKQPEFKESFFEDFRMSFESFQLLCELLTPHLKESSETLTASVPIDKQIALCLYKLATCAEYKVVGHVFGLHKSTICKYFHVVVNALLNLHNEFIYFPKEPEAIQIAKSFESISYIPNIIGCIDGTHIPILPPSEGYRDYINRKGWPSMVLQAVVDNNYIFRDISIQFPGSAHDATVFKESGLYKNSAKMIPKHLIQLEGVNLPMMLAGDPAYPLLEWVLKSYTGNLTPEEESFNCYLSSARIRIENAFGRLKGRWRCLAKRLDVNPKFVPKVVAACAILHNFVERQKEQFMENWTELDSGFIEPIPSRNNEIGLGSVSDPKTVRIHIKNYLAKNYPLRKSSYNY